MADRQVQMRFTTKLPQQFKVDGGAFSLPVYLNRHGLSQIINTLLGSENPTPFDFLLDGELIRTTLEQLYLSKNLSAESVLVVEYILAVGPPQLGASIPGKDWISSVNGAHSSLIFSGSYDSYTRAWSAEGSLCGVLEGHSDAITGIVIVGSRDDVLEIATSSKDKSLRLWEVPTKASTVTVKASRVFKEHSASVQCVAANPSGNLICSGSWDSSMKLWKTEPDEPDEEDDQASKTRKLEGGEKRAEFPQASSFSTLRDHTQCVSALEWPEESIIFSVSWDHTLRQWDAHSGVNTLTLTCSKALHCLSVGGENSSLIVTGGADQFLRIWDPRVPGNVTPVSQLSSHKAWITSCKWHRQSTNHLLSASHDGTIKMWDIRSKVPLQTLEAHKDKVLCADWLGNDGIVSGGADSELKVFNYTDVF